MLVGRLVLPLVVCLLVGPGLGFLHGGLALIRRREPHANTQPHDLRGSLSSRRVTGRAMSMMDSEAFSHGDLPSEKYVLTVLGDLHLDRTKMALHEEARDQLVGHMKALQQELGTENAPHVVSLGDLGAYGEAGTTKSFQLAKDYLDGFGFKYSLVTGNHDLEGMDEFDTDYANLKAWMNHFNLKSPCFCHQIANRTLCVGLSTTRFRSSPFSSHEVHIDDSQIVWLEDLLERHPESQGWKVGASLRVLQSVHVKNGCAWLNHSGTEEERRIFLRLCKKFRAIKAWFSGHFHLSHDYADSISFCEETSTCFVQVGVIGEKSQRDGRRQTRMVTGDDKGLKVYTVGHHKGGALRLDVSITYTSEGNDVVDAHGHEDFDHDKWFAAYVPEEEDGCYLQSPDGVVLGAEEETGKGANVVCWWHMRDGRVLGVHDGMVVEYDSETLSPLGIVCDQKMIAGREVVVAGNGRALMLAPPLESIQESTVDSSEITIIHPNEDGSYWRKFQRNKLLRTREKEREAMAKDWLVRLIKEREVNAKVDA